jgi:7-cyano-7-deazaguanine synthase in queuosine biosynthesis
MEPEVLIAFSGGLDSTFILWQHLIENPNSKALVFHVELNTKREPRAERENMAVKEILKWFTENGLNNFEYIEGFKFDYGDFRRVTIKDIQIISMFKAIILKREKYNSITKIKFGWHRGEVNSEEINKGFRVKKMFEALEVNRKIEFLFPIEHLTRKDMVEKLPNDLLKLISSCRKPILNKPCKKCKTCLEFINEGLMPL